MSKENEMTPNEDAYDKLDQILIESEEKGRALAKKGRDLTKSGQFITDLSRATRDVIKVYKPPINVEVMINSWSASNQMAEEALGAIGKIDLLAVNSTGGTSAQAAFVLGVTLPHARPLIKEKIDTLNEVIQRSIDENEVQNLLTSFGYDSSVEGRKSALDLFNTAHNAFENPVEEGNPISTSLIPMREAIKSVIDDLLRRRPMQEKTRGEENKIVSIGSQLKRDAIPSKLINTWAYQWHELLTKYLSPSKQEDIPRDDWRHRLQQATLFLKNFLSGLDQSKMR